MGIKELFTGKDEITTEINNARKYLQPRLDRMKEDIDKHYLLEKYVFKDLKDKEHKGINNVTLNDSRLYADTMVRILGTAKWRLNISSEVEGLADSAEKFVEWCLVKGDENLVYQNLMSLDPSHNFTSCVEGTIAARVILYRNGDLWYPELIPLDPYSVIYVSGKRGCRIVSVESTRPADEIYNDYEYKVKGTTGKVQDIWTVDQNITKVDGTVVRTVAHPLGMNPIIVVPCPTTPFLTSQTDAAKYQAESIYAGVRDMYDTQNREATGWSTQNWMGFLPPVVGIMKTGRTLPKLDYGIGAQVSLEEGERVDSWPIKDLSVAHQTYFGQIGMRIQQATFSNIQYGQSSFELSAVAIKELAAKFDQHFVPRLTAKKIMMMQIAYNLINQFVNGGYPTDLKGLGEKISEWKPTDFKDKNFVIRVDYFSQAPEENIADTTIAISDMNLGLPPEWIYKNRLKIADVPEVMRMRAREMAMKLSPDVAMYWAGQMLKDSKDPLDKGISELLIEAPTEGQGAGVTNSPSQPTPPLGLTMPPLTPGAKVQREQLRREGISKEGQTPPPGR